MRLRGKLALNEADDPVRRDLDAPGRARRLRCAQNASDIGLRDLRGSPAHAGRTVGTLMTHVTGVWIKHSRARPCAYKDVCRESVTCVIWQLIPAWGGQSFGFNSQAIKALPVRAVPVAMKIRGIPASVSGAFASPSVRRPRQPMRPKTRTTRSTTPMLSRRPHTFHRSKRR